MNNKFDELTKSMAQSVTRRGALKKFGIGLAGMALACFGFADRADAGKWRRCSSNADCASGEVCCNGYCDGFAYGSIPGNPCACFANKKFCGTKLSSCDSRSGDCALLCAANLPCP
jgi:hypothetical protein